jgi:peptide/nickel transport system permease protein
MREFLVRRLIQSALLLWLLMTFTFFLTRATPGGPEAAFLESPRISHEEIARMRERFGLNDPAPVAYVKWLSSALTLDFGRSYYYLRPPLDIIKERIWPTVQLGLVAYLFAFIGIPLGVTAAFHRGKFPDIAIRVFTVLWSSMPTWWTALVIIVILSVTIHWFPQGQGRGGPIEWFTHIIIPAAILGLGGTVAFTRYVRNEVLETLGQDFVRVAYAKGLPDKIIVGRHILRNSLLPVITLLGGFLPGLLSGAALMEGIFNWPGMGRLYLEAAATRDYPLLLAMITMLTFATLVGMLMSDLAYGIVDPRIRYKQ